MTGMALPAARDALLDFQKEKEAMARRAANFDPKAAAEHALSGDVILPQDAVDAMAAPVRIVITFGDPIHTRRQIEALQATLVEALVVTQDHGRGLNRQRLDLRGIIKRGADTLVYMNGKNPTNKKKLNSR